MLMMLNALEDNYSGLVLYGDIKHIWGWDGLE